MNDEKETISLVPSPPEGIDVPCKVHAIVKAIEDINTGQDIYDAFEELDIGVLVHMGNMIKHVLEVRSHELIEYVLTDPFNTSQSDTFFTGK